MTDEYWARNALADPGMTAHLVKQLDGMNVLQVPREIARIFGLMLGVEVEDDSPIRVLFFTACIKGFTLGGGQIEPAPIAKLSRVRKRPPKSRR